MENERKEYKEKTNYGKQVFYFNDKGQLVVESNKGVWVDGEKFVKMYGDFTCNAKTMGEIIHQLKGIAVEVGQYEKAIYSSEPGNLTAYCVLGASQERIEEYEKGGRTPNKEVFHLIHYYIYDFFASSRFDEEKQEGQYIPEWAQKLMQEQYGIKL